MGEVSQVSASTLEDQLKKLELIVSNVANAVLICDQNGDIEWANKGFTELTGFTLNEVIGKDPFEILYSQLSNQIVKLNLYKKVISGQEVRETIVNHDRNGNPYWLELRVNPIFNENRNIVNYVAVGIDVTERMKSRLEIEERTNLLESIAHTMPVVIYIWNIKESRVEFISNHIYNLTGYTQDDLMSEDGSQKFQSLLFENDLTKILSSYKKIISDPNHSMTSNSFRVKHLNGEIKRVNSREIVYRRSKDGTPTHLICSMADVTEHYNAEKYREALIRLQELQQKRTQKIRTLTMLQGQEEERKRLSRELHDGIGQLLTAVRIKINNLEGKTDNLDFEKQLGEIKSLVFQTIKETRNISNALVPVDLYDFGIHASLKNLCDNALRDSGIAVSFMSNLEDIRFSSTIEIEVYRIAQEAINNSIKYSQSKTIDVNIFFNAKSGLLKLLIIDEGVGFEYSPSSISRNSKNISFGLRNMNERARIINGKINIISQSGQGCVVSLEVPVKQTL
jgi:PAS domain S-box-containing protein